jgi:hypothetical protein
MYNNFKAELATLNSKSVSIANTQISLGLMSGKMGYCKWINRNRAWD